MASFSDTQISALKAPLSSANVKIREQGKSKLSYIEAWHAIDEANRIFGFDAWDRETIDYKCVVERQRKIGQGQYERDGWGVTYTAKVRVTVGSIVREGSGAGHGIDADLGLAHESALKEAESDAMKRALMTFGNPFGLALYDKTQTNVADAAEIARNEALESLWTELCSIRTDAGLRSFWTDNAKSVGKMDEFNRQRFTKKKDELKAKFEDDHFPGDTDITDAGGRRLHTMEA